MYFNIATDVVVMVNGTDYKPQWVNDAPLLKNSVGSPYDTTNNAADSRCGVGHYDKMPIFKVQVGKNTLSTGYIRMWLWNTDDATHVDIPYTGFKEGSVYEMFVRKYTIVDGSGNPITGQDANFILVGHKTGAMPMNLL